MTSRSMRTTKRNNSLFTIKKDKSQPVTKIGEYAFNCDGTLEVINIAATVTKIDERAFYSCWNLQCIYVDDNMKNLNTNAIENICFGSLKIRM